VARGAGTGARTAGARRRTALAPGLRGGAEPLGAIGFLSRGGGAAGGVRAGVGRGCAEHGALLRAGAPGRRAAPLRDLVSSAAAAPEAAGRAQAPGVGAVHAAGAQARMLALNSGRARRAESRCSGARPGEGESEEEGEAECFDTSSRAQKDFDSLGAEGEGERVGKGEGEGNGSKGSQAMEATVDEGGAVDGAEGAAGAAGEEGAAGADQACEAPREPGADAAAGTGGGERAAGSAGEGANRVGPHQGT
jgi:hypothetical protein